MNGHLLGSRHLSGADLNIGKLDEVRGWSKKGYPRIFRLILTNPWHLMGLDTI